MPLKQDRRKQEGLCPSVFCFGACCNVWHVWLWTKYIVRIFSQLRVSQLPIHHHRPLL